MKDISLHVLDVVENSLAAEAMHVKVEIVEDHVKGILIVKISDDGKGMSKIMLGNVLDPFYTTKPGKKTGLGLPLLAQAAREGGGDIRIDSEPGHGAEIEATFRLDHPDTKPIGDMETTMDVLRMSHPDIEFIYKRQTIR